MKNVQPGRALEVALTLTLGYSVVEALAGWWAGSLALLSDAGHMLGDAASLGIAALPEDGFPLRCNPATQ